MKIAGISIYKKSKKKNKSNIDPSNKDNLKHDILTNFTIDGVTSYKTILTHKFDNREKYTPEEEGNIITLIPGVITKISIKKGAKVKVGDSLCILDAMKMNNDICSTLKGKVEEICVSEGDHVKKGDILFKINPDIHKKHETTNPDDNLEILAF